MWISHCESFMPADAVDNEDDELMQIFDDIEEIIEDQIFITHLV